MKHAFPKLWLTAATLAMGICFSSDIALGRSAEATVPPMKSSPPEWGWRCSGQFEVDGQRVSMWRDFDASGTINPYIIQSFDREPHGTTWTIDPRPETFPPDGKAFPSMRGRNEAEVLREGPDYVHISYEWHTEAVGPIYVYFWGDGIYVGAEQLFSARQVRR
jgi:hypothetical protein